MSAATRPGADRRPNSPRTDLTAIIVATGDASPVQVSGAVMACGVEIAQVLVVAIAGSTFVPGDCPVTVVTDHDVERALRAAARLATTSRCLLVDPEQSWVPGSAAGHAVFTADIVSTVAPPLPAVDREGPGPARAVIARRFGLAIPTERLASGAFNPSFGDVAGALRSLEQLRADGVEFVELPHAETPGHDDLVRAGVEALRLYRVAPHTLADTGLGTYRNVSYSAFVRRRLSSMRPQWLGRKQGSSRHAGVAFWEGVRGESSPAEWAGLTAATPILMYHAFADRGPKSRYVVTRRHLRRQLRLLKLSRRQPMSLDDYVAVRRAHGLVAPRSVVITIDDGYADAYTVATPEFRRAGVTATLFVPTGHVGGHCDWTAEPALAGRRMATWEQMESAFDTIAIGSHARHHVALDELDDADVVAQLTGSADDVDAALGRPPTTFAYPFGAESSRTRRHVEASTYLAGCTSRGGRNSVVEPLHSLRRVEIRGDASLWAFGVALATGSSLSLRTQLRGGR